MGKAVYIAEKPSVAQEFAKALKLNAKRKDGYLESEEAIVTWCVGHLVTMSYPEVYDPALKKWSLNTLPFLPSGKAVPDRQLPFKQTGCGHDLRVYRLRTGRRVYLPAGGAGSTCDRKTKKTGLDRFADGGGDSSRDPAGKGLIRV